MFGLERFPSFNGGVFKNFLCKFRDDSSGAILILFAFMLPILVGMVGLGIETAWWYYNKRTLQAAADSAAIAAAYELRRDPDISDSDLMDFVHSEATRLGFTPGTATFTLATPPNDDVNYSGSFGDDTSAVYVTIAQTKSTMFAAMAGLDGLDIVAGAVATEVQSPGVDSCMIGLRDDGTAIHFSGDANTTVIDCVPTSNGDLIAQGSTVVTAECLSVAGDYIDRGAHVEINLACGDSPLGFQGPIIEDPYLGLAAPSALGGCQFNNMDGGSVVPGVYCSDGNNGEIGIQETTNFAPGIYYFNGTSLRINAGTVITGGPVIFVFTERDGRTGGGDITINGTANITLAAPIAEDFSTYSEGFSDFDSEVEGFTNEDWAGILIHSDVEGGTIMINGTSDSVIYGTIHAPTSEVSISGDSDVDSDDACLQVIAYTVTITGSQDFTTKGCDDSVKTANIPNIWSGLVQ